MRVRLETLGCRLNLGEILQLGRELRLRGHGVVGPAQAADLILLNTCTVTHVADRKSRKTLRRLRRNHPEATLVVTGCFGTELRAPDGSARVESEGERAAERVLALGADLVVDNSEKDRLLERLEREGLLPAGEAEPVSSDPRLTAPRGFLKVQDGCDQACSFCIVTLARGAARSRPIPQLLEELRILLSEGCQEVVLSGVHLGGWGQDLPGAPELADLVRRVLEETALSRLRLSSVEPWNLSPAFLALFADPRLMPHLHLPLQSGSDRILRRMARRTSREHFAGLVEAARAVRPELAITSDLIVGFPGESEADFEASLELCERLALSGLHVFPYSPRAGTAAASFEGAVPPAVRDARMLRALELSGRLERACWRGSLGQTRAVLFESFEDTEEGRLHTGLTDHFQRVVVRTEASRELRGAVLPTRLLELEATGLIGELEAS